MLDYSNRPRPLADVASRVATAVGTLSALATALAGAGIALITTEQANAVTGLLGAIPGVVALAGAAWAAFKVKTDGEPLVTPVEDPMVRDMVTGKLVPLVRQAT